MREPVREPAQTIINGNRARGDKDSPPSTAEVGDEAACFMLWREMRELPVIARFTVEGEPVSKSRARFTKKGSKTQAYTPEKTHVAEQAVGWKFRAAARGHKLDPEATYGVMALFFCGTRQRRDVDNMLKLILDGLNGVAWPDDEQVTEVSARKSLVLPPGARTEVMVYRVGNVQRFTGNCEHCKKEFATYPCMADRKRYCSTACANAARQVFDRRVAPCAQCGMETLLKGQQRFCGSECKEAAGRVTVSCSGCGIEFTKQRCFLRAKNYCSQQCRDSAMRERRGIRARGTCQTCGGPTTKKSYRQCQACSWGRAPVSGKPVLAITDTAAGDSR